MSITDHVPDLSIVENGIELALMHCTNSVIALCVFKHLSVEQVGRVSFAVDDALEALYHRWGRAYSDSDSEQNEWEVSRLAPYTEFVSTHPDISVDQLECLTDAYAVTDEALRLFAAGNLGETIIRIQMAADYIGQARIKIHGRADSLREFARKGADARHRETNELKADALAYFEANRESFRSLDHAAEIIARDVVPVATRTARDWLKGRGPLKPRNPA